MAALAAAGGLVPVEAHYGGTYYDIVVDVTEYERTAYNGFDLVRMKLSIENLAGYTMESPAFLLGGHPEYQDDPADNPDTAVQSEYGMVTYAEVRGRGGDVSVQDCSAVDRWSDIPDGGTGEALLCFMVGKAFQPDGLAIGHHTGDGRSHVQRDDDEPLGVACGHDPHPGWTDLPRESSWVDGWHYGWAYETCNQAIQVIPFHDESVYCFDHNFELCNADNVQPIDGAPVSQPAPDPEPPLHATLLHTAYYNHTGTLVLAFDRAVIPGNPDRIYLIHDVDAFLGNGTAPDLGGSKLYTVDGKRQSTILAFALDGALRMEVTESLRGDGYLGVLIDTRAIYAAEDFTDITKRDGTQMLVPDIVVVR